MKLLYVIGNGFDLWHSLPTRYTDFYKYSESYLDELEQYLTPDVSSENPWNDFEAYLGKFDWRKFYNTYNFIDISDESFRPSMAYSLKDSLSTEAESLVDGIKTQLQEWIGSVPVEDVKKKFHFNSMGRFITFNYTPLLQIVYGIDDDLVFHIHGSASRYDELILGHGDTMEVEPEFDKEGNSNRTMFTDAEGAASYPFYAFQKPVNEILNCNISYFESLKDIEVVVVMGHSLNDIDIPYFKKISEVAENAKWFVSHYTEDEKQSHSIQLKKCGVSSDRITLCSIDDIPKILTCIQLA